MARFGKPGLVRVTHDDPVVCPLEEKVIAGPGTQISVKASPYGHQLVIHAIGAHEEAAHGTVVETTASKKLGPEVSMAIIKAHVQFVEITLPHPGEVLGWLTLVCVDNKAGVSLRPLSGTNIFDASNIEFNSPGDALVFASNRKDTWYCISRYTAHFDY